MKTSKQQIIAMELEQLKEPVISGFISVIAGLLITYAYHTLVKASGDIQWAMIAVGISSFFSAFFSVYQN